MTLPARSIKYDLALAKELSQIIEKALLQYLSSQSDISATDFIQCYSQEFLELTCPEAIQLQAACIVDERTDELFIGIHVSTSTLNTLCSCDTVNDLISHPDGLQTFLVLIEEISHFHHILRRANSNSKISRFDLELQAEVDKVIIGSIVFRDMFGKSHINELVSLLFDKSTITSTLTDYKSASKIAEKFLKENIQHHGPNVIFDSRFRKIVQIAANNQGEEKIQILSKKLSVA